MTPARVVAEAEASSNIRGYVRFWNIRKGCRLPTQRNAVRHAEFETK